MRNLVNNSNWRVDAFDTPAYIQERALIEVTTHSAIADDTLYLTCGTITATYYVAYENKLVIDVSELVRMNASGTLTLACGNATDLSVSWTRGGLINPTHMLIPKMQNGDVLAGLGEITMFNPVSAIEDMPFAQTIFEMYPSAADFLSRHSWTAGANQIGFLNGSVWDSSFGRSKKTALIGGRKFGTLLQGAYKNYWAQLFNAGEIRSASLNVNVSEKNEIVFPDTYYAADNTTKIAIVNNTPPYNLQKTSLVTTTKQRAQITVSRNFSLFQFGVFNDNSSVQNFTGYIFMSNMQNYIPDSQAAQFSGTLYLQFDYYRVGHVVHIEDILITSNQNIPVQYGIAQSQLPCRKYACVQWVSRSGVTKRATWEVRKIADTTSESTELERIDNAYDVRKGQEQTMQLVMENLAAYDFWYYSDIVTSSDVRVTFDASGYDATNDTLTEACKVEVTDKKVQQLDGNGGGFSTLAVNINYKRYDTV